MYPLVIAAIGAIGYWFFKPTKIKRKPGKDSKGERNCADVLKKIYPNHTFEKIRPDWLKNPKTKRNLELDLYNEKLKLGIEFQGQQHYKYTPKFHDSVEDFNYQVWKDKLKRQLCNKRGVKLVAIPYNTKNLEEYLRKKLK